MCLKDWDRSMSNAYDHFLPTIIKLKIHQLLLLRKSKRNDPYKNIVLSTCSSYETTFDYSIQCNSLLAQDFTEVSAIVGIDHEAIDDNKICGGVILIDINNDNYIDVFAPGGGKSPITSISITKTGLFRKAYHLQV